MVRIPPASVRVLPAAVVLALAAAALLPGVAAAQAMNFGAFKMMITEKEMKLEHLDDAMWDKYLMKDLPYQRMNDRNMPTIELTNDPASTAPITQFQLTIGDERFNFSDAVLGVFAKLAKTTPGFSLTSSTLGNAGDVLVVKIGGGGLAPGDSLRFKIDLDVDAAYRNQFWAQPDYRTVLFDMNGINVYSGFSENNSTDDNAKATATFDPAVGANFDVGPVALTDATVPGLPGGFYNNNYRKYRDKDPVRTFQVSASAQAVIPEPASASLFAAGLVGAALLGLRKRAIAGTR